VGDVGVGLHGVWKWYFRWRKSCFTWEVCMVESLKKDLEGMAWVDNVEDKVLWKNYPTSFLVKNAYAFLSLNHVLLLKICSIRNFGNYLSRQMLWFSFGGSRTIGYGTLTLLPNM